MNRAKCPTLTHTNEKAPRFILKVSLARRPAPADCADSYGYRAKPKSPPQLPPSKKLPRVHTTSNSPHHSARRAILSRHRPCRPTHLPHAIPGLSPLPPRRARPASRQAQPPRPARAARCGPTLAPRPRSRRAPRPAPADKPGIFPEHLKFVRAGTIVSLAYGLREESMVMLKIRSDARATATRHDADRD